MLWTGPWAKICQSCVALHGTQNNSCLSARKTRLLGFCFSDQYLHLTFLVFDLNEMKIINFCSLRESYYFVSEYIDTFLLLNKVKKLETFKALI